MKSRSGRRLEPLSPILPKVIESRKDNLKRKRDDVQETFKKSIEDSSQFFSSKTGNPPKERLFDSPSSFKQIPSSILQRSPLKEKFRSSPDTASPFEITWNSKGEGKLDSNPIVKSDIPRKKKIKLLSILESYAGRDSEAPRFKYLDPRSKD